MSYVDEYLEHLRLKVAVIKLFNLKRALSAPGYYTVDDFADTLNMHPNVLRKVLEEASYYQSFYTPSSLFSPNCCPFCTEAIGILYNYEASLTRECCEICDYGERHGECIDEESEFDAITRPLSSKYRKLGHLGLLRYHLVAVNTVLAGIQNYLAHGEGLAPIDESIKHVDLLLDEANRLERETTRRSARLPYFPTKTGGI